MTPLLHSLIPTYHWKPSLADRLPPEILGEIFLSFVSLPGEDMESWNGTVRTTANGDNPLVLTQVCWYWRTVALQLRGLWTSIYVAFPTLRHIPLVNTWLDRAGSSPLTLVLHDFLDPELGESDVASTILRLFARRFENWKNIDFVVGIRNSPFVDILQDVTCPILESASILTPNWDLYALNDLWTRLQQSPVLRYVDGQLVFRFTHFNQVSWNQLRVIRARLPSPPMDIFRLLQTCPELEVLDIHCGSSQQDTPSPFVTHGRLRSLQITIDGDTTIPFSKLCLPSLDIFKIQNNASFMRDEMIFEIQKLFEHSGCTLKGLYIFDVANVDELLEKSLSTSATNKLLRFEVASCQYTEKTREILGGHPSRCVQEWVLALSNCI